MSGLNGLGNSIFDGLIPLPRQHWARCTARHRAAAVSAFAAILFVSNSIAGHAQFSAAQDETTPQSSTPTNVREAETPLQQGHTEDPMSCVQAELSGSELLSPQRPPL